MTQEPSDNEQRYLHPAKHGDLAELNALDAYEQWQEDEYIPVYRGLAFRIFARLSCRTGTAAAQKAPLWISRGRADSSTRMW